MSSDHQVREISPEDVIVTLRGQVPHDMIEQAKEQVAHAARFSRRDVLDATVTITEDNNPANPDSSRVEVLFNIAGAPVRAESDAPTPQQALDGVIDRLERRITDQANRWDDRSRWLNVAAEEGEWRHGDAPTDRPDHFPRPVDEREVVRRKTFAVGLTSVEEAVYDMEALGHDFFLFTDAATGVPALVHRRSDGSFGVAGLEGDDDTVPTSMTREPSPPTIDEVTARQRLDASGEPFVFYLDEASGKGSAVYLRYDGHYGIITAS